MSEPIEQRLRQALHAGAQAIAQLDAAGSPRTLPSDAPEGLTAPKPSHVGMPRAGGRGPWLLAAVAAAVIAFSVAALGVRRSAAPPPLPPVGSLTPTQPGTATPTGAPSTPATASPTASPSGPRVIDGVHAAKCTARPADPLGAVLKPVLVLLPEGSYNFAGLPILSVTAAGDVLAGTAGDNRYAPGGLDVIAPDRSRRTLYRTTDVSLPAPSETSATAQAAVTAADGDSGWIVFGVSVGLPGQMSLQRLAMANRATGAVTVFRTLAPRSTTTLLPPVMFGGQAYWFELDGASGKVLRYDPRTGQTVTLDQGSNLTPPVALGGGLYWLRDGHPVAYHPGSVPAGFPLNGAKIPRFATDGTSTVWTTTTPDAKGVLLVLSRAGWTRPLTLTASNGEIVFEPLAVAGPYVVWSDGQQYTMLDTRTGAAAQLGTASPGFGTVAAGGGTLAVNQIGSKGGAQLAIAAVASIPELHC